MNVVGLYGGSSDNLDIKNNLVINSNTAYNTIRISWSTRKAAPTISNLQVLNNSTTNLDPEASSLRSWVFQSLTHWSF